MNKKFLIQKYGTTNESARTNTLLLPLSKVSTGVISLKTQFEIERRSCGQSMTNFRFFSCRGQTILQVVILFYDVPLGNLTKKMEKNVQNQSSCGFALGTALTD